jgi:hypothetical protein
MIAEYDEPSRTWRPDRRTRAAATRAAAELRAAALAELRAGIDDREHLVGDPDDYVRCIGGPLDGQGFTREQWTTRRDAALAMRADGTTRGTPAADYTPGERRPDPTRAGAHRQAWTWRDAR